MNQANAKQLIGVVAYLKFFWHFWLWFVFQKTNSNIVTIRPQIPRSPSTRSQVFMGSSQSSPDPTITKIGMHCLKVTIAKTHTALTTMVIIRALSGSTF